MPERTYKMEDFVGGGLGLQWEAHRQKMGEFLATLGVTDDTWSKAIYFRAISTNDIEDTKNNVRASANFDENWEYFQSVSGDKKLLHFIPTRQTPYLRSGRPPNVLHFYIEVHSRLVCWWLTNAWRSRQLADAAYALGDAMQVIPAAACARSLLETAASLLDETKKIHEKWRCVKTDCEKNGPSIHHYLDIWKAQWGAKFSKYKLPELANSYGIIERPNVLTLIEKLSKTSKFPIQQDYEWLCNAVHPSVGGMLSYSGPFLEHVTGTHLMQTVAPFPISLESVQSAEAVTLKIIQESVVRATIFSVDVLGSILDDALRIIDDIALTTRATTQATFSYWRNIKQEGKHSLCPCRSGRKVKDCAHRWNDPPPPVHDHFEAGE